MHASLEANVLESDLTGVKGQCLRPCSLRAEDSAVCVNNASQQEGGFSCPSPLSALGAETWLHLSWALVAGMSHPWKLT